MVAFYHSLRPFAEIPRDTGLISVMNGHTAVMFFFILSGFVLSRSLERAGNLSWTAVSGYWIRRFFRLYPLVVFAVMFSAGVAVFYSTSQEWARVAPWPAKMMELSKNLSGIREYISCLVLHVSYLNAPLWTIRVELVCSALLPFVVFAVTSTRHHFAALAIIVVLFFFYYSHTPHFIASTQYMLHFALGFAAWKLTPLFERVGKTASSFAMLALLLGLFATNYFNLGGMMQAGLLFLLFCFLVPCRPVSLKKILLASPLQFLGKISFSFYALHWPVMLLLFSIMQENFSPDVPTGWLFGKGLFLFAASSVTTIGLAAVSERWIERPANALGHRLSALWVGHLGKKATQVN